MQLSDDEVDFSKVSFHKNKSNPNLTIYADIINKSSPCLRVQAIKSQRTITPKSVVESVSEKLKGLEVSDSLKHRLRNKRSLHECSKTHHNICSIKKPVYSTTKFETQNISASQLLQAIDNAEELHNVASKGFTQEFEVSFQVENFKVGNKNDLEKAAAIIEAELVKTDLYNELELSQNSIKLTPLQAGTKNSDDLPSAKMTSNYIAIETNANENHKLKSIIKNTGNSPRKNINLVQKEANCELNDKSNSDNKILNKTYCIAKEQIHNLGPKDEFKIKKNTDNASINKSEVQNIQNKFSITEIAPSPVFSIVDRQETVLSPHIICNLDDFEKFEQLAVSFKEYTTADENDYTYSQILGANENTKEHSDQNNIEDIYESSDSLGEDDKAQLDNILHIKDNSDDLNISPVLPIQTVKTKFDTEFEKLQSFSDMELTCKDAAVNILSNQNLHTNDLENKVIDAKEVVSKQKVDDFLEDDILFSSDEEDEYMQKKFSELPLTCALETSFYTTQSHVLDKTMFVGFQTASNKYISVSTDSFCKAQSMMDDKDCNLGPSLTELVNMCEKSAIKNKPFDDDAGITRNQTASSSVIKTIECLDKSKNKCLSIIEAKNALETNCNFIGFKTASNKNIDLSEKSRQRILKVFQDIDLTEDFNKEKNCCDEAIPDNGLAAIENRKSKDENTNACNQTGSNDLFTEIEFTDTEMNVFDEVENLKIIPDSNLDQTKFERFRTASDKAISVSEKALQISNKVFKDIDSNQVITNAMLNCDAKSTRDNYVFKKPESPLRKTKNIVGFKTASNNTMSLLNNAIKVGSKMFDDINTDILTNKAETPQTNASCQRFCGFQTASNKKVIISEKALELSKKLLQDIEINSDEPIMHDKRPLENLPSIVSFKTANNKPIHISNNTVENCRKVFENIDSLDEMILQSSSHNRDTQRAINLDENSVRNKRNVKEDETNFVGFQTASYKKIKISMQSLEKTKNIFDDLKELHSKTHDAKTNKKVGLSDDENANSKTVNLLNKTPNFIEFQTANNKIINISKQSLGKPQSIFNNIDDTEAYHINNKYSSKAPKFKTACTISITDRELNENTVNCDENDELKNTEKRCFKGFQTASNKRVKITNEAKAKTKDIFNEIINYNEQKDFNKLDKEFKGFQTANNKNIVVSQDALARTKDIFKELPDFLKSDSITYSDFGGFQTGNKKPIFISEEALKNSKKIFNDIQVEENVNPKSDSLTTPNFAGFQTGNKKPIFISEEALKNSKKIFNDIQVEENVNPKSDSLTTPNFAGFQTGNKKPIFISEEALKNSKKIFNDIQVEENVNPISDGLTIPKFAGFQTGNKKAISVSEEALKRSKIIFNDIENKGCDNLSKIANDKPSKSFAFCFQNANQKEVQVSQKSLDTIRNNETKTTGHKTPEKHIVNEANLMLDTQALTNFENTLFTEDFCKDSTPIQAKRSGSPILSCPKAKKRKSFQTPYKADKALKTLKVIDKVEETTAPIAYEFNNNNYKKNKTINLKILQKLEKESKIKTSTIDERLMNINMENILQFKFDDHRNDLLISKFKKTLLTVEDLKTLFLESIDKKIVPEGWIENHLKLIIWKLLSYEVIFPKVMNKVCTASNVINQLKYRYDRELYNVERPALRKILEKDELASKCIVLCVVNFVEDGNIVKSLTDINKTIELTLTDGWYSVRASIDKMLTKLVYDGKIVVGCKIITHGAELVNCDQGKSPLEDISEVRLKIFGNSTRLVRWHTKLGFFASAAILNRLSTVKVNGGKVSKLRLYVTRVYPMLYVEKFDDGSTITRSERLETLYQNKFETHRQSLMEKLYEEIETELSDEDSQDSTEYKEPSSKRKCLDSGSQIARAMKLSKDPVEFRSNLTDSQVQLLNEYTNKQRDRILQQIQIKIREKMEKSGSNCTRNVVPLLKVRVADINERDGAIHTCQGYISIWRPNEAVSEIINEGEWIDVLNALPTAFRYQEIQLTAGRQTVFNKITPKLEERISLHAKKLLRHCKEIKDSVKNPHEDIDYNEIDTIGIVTEIDPPNSNYESSGRQFQNIYLADLEKNMICLNFWGGIKKFGFENILDTGQFVYGRNLQKRVGNTRKSIPQFRVTEFSVFTKTPKNILERNLLENFVKRFSNINKKQFCDDCNLIRRKTESNKYNLNEENISPFRINYSDYNLSKNRQYFESPLAQNNRKDDEFRLTGLDFESTFKQTDTQNLSPELLKKKRIAQAKIARLKMYGEPPPLSPIHILNKSKNATAAFKSPLMSNQNKSIPTVSPKTTNELLPLVENRSTSPVFSSNTTFNKKFLNPVKLNFNVDNGLNGSIDQFAGDFDSSPPLSLD